MKQLGILAPTINNTYQIHTSKGKPLDVRLRCNLPSNARSVTLMVSYDPETPDDYEQLKLDENGWLRVFEENESYGELSPILTFALTRTGDKQFNINNFRNAVNLRCSQSRQVDKNKLLNDIWQISLYASKNRQGDIISVIGQFDQRYTVTAEKAIMTEAIDYCQRVLETTPLPRHATVNKNVKIDRLTIFGKINVMNAIIGVLNEHNLPQTDNRLVNLIKWRHGHCDEFDHDTLKSFFHCFSPLGELNILRKIACEIQTGKTRLMIADLVDLVDSNQRIKRIQSRNYNYYNTTLYSEILVHSIHSYINTGKFLSQGRILDIINGIEDRHSKIDLGYP